MTSYILLIGREFVNIKEYKPLISFADQETGALLVCHNDDVADLDTLRAVHRKDDYIGYIFRLKGINTFINGSSSFLVAMETDFAEWRFHDTRLDGSDFDVAVYDFDTDAVTESFYRRFGRTVDRGSGVSVESRCGTEVYDMPRVPLKHGGKEGTGHKEKSFDVCVDGLDDIIDIVAAVRFKTSGKSCVIYEDIGGARFGKAAAGSVCTAS